MGLGQRDPFSPMLFTVAMLGCPHCIGGRGVGACSHQLSSSSELPCTRTPLSSSVRYNRAFSETVDHMLRAAGPCIHQGSLLEQATQPTGLLLSPVNVDAGFLVQWWMWIACSGFDFDGLFLLVLAGACSTCYKTLYSDQIPYIHL